MPLSLASCPTRVFGLSLKAGIIVLLLLTAVMTVNSTSTEIYLDWQVKDPAAGGHLTVSNYPPVLEDGQTYQVELTFTLEWLDWGDTVEFQMIQWFVDTGESENQLFLGYSAVDSMLKKNESVTVSSHWSLRRHPLNETGWLKMNATVILHDSTQPSETRVPTISQIRPSIQVSLKVENHLTLTLSPRTVEKGQSVTANGTLVPAVAGATINLTYVKPNGEKVIRWANTDQQGNFSDKYTPDVEGTWSVKASWTGTEHYTASSSNLVVFKVDPQSPLVPAIAGLAVLLVIFGPTLVRIRKETVSEDIT